MSEASSFCHHTPEKLGLHQAKAKPSTISPKEKRSGIIISSKSITDRIINAYTATKTTKLHKLSPFLHTNNTVSTAYALPVSFSGNSTTINTTGANLHDNTDIDYYKIQLNSGRNYSIRPRLHDSYSSGNGTYYTVDAKFAYSTDGNNWSEYYDDEMGSNISVQGGGTLYFCVLPYFEGKTGTYLLDISITIGTGMDETNETSFSLYPNPVKETLNVNCEDSSEIRLYNPLGVMVKAINAEGKETVQIDMSGLPCGTYLLQAIGDCRVVTRKVVKTE